VSRLRHRFSGFVRTLQISRHSVFAFVEGKKIDSNFYGNICRGVCDRSNLSYQIRLARELPYKTGGKCTLIRFYRYLRRNKKLIMNFGSKKAALVFFLDKDVDDVLRKKCRSTHVIYTKYYEIHNHLFLNGDLVKAVAVATSIDENRIRHSTFFRNNWCRSAAHRWREWVILCLFSRIYRVGNRNYGACSRINSPINGFVDDNLFKAEVKKAQRCLGWTTNKMHAMLSRVEKIVDRHFANDSQDTIFKGKWYSTLIEQDLREFFRGKNVDISGVANRIEYVLAATLDYKAPWTEHFTGALEQVLAEL
jgi:hypothetical protein